jgi:hypothetical protein
MKNGLHINPLMLKAVVLLTCFMLVMFYNKAKAQAPAEVQAKQPTIVAVK